MTDNGADALAAAELKAQKGDADDQLDAALAYMADAKPASIERAIHWIRKVFLTNSTRVEPDQIVPANTTSLEVRAKTITLAKSTGPDLVDMIIRTSVCSKCGDDSTDKALMGVEGTKFYRTVWDLIAWALLSSCSIQPPEALCAKCGSALQMLFIDYHHFVKESGVDLVVRCTTLGSDFSKSYSLLWFDGENYKVVSQDDVRDEDKLDAEYFANSINSYCTQGKFEEAAAAAKLAVQQYPGDPALLKAVTALLNGGKAGVSEAIIDMHLSKNPYDPLALLGKAELLLHTYRVGTPPKPELLKDADEAVNRATSLSGRNNWQEAELLRCDIARLSGKDKEQVESLYLQLVAKYPKFAAARYGIALHYLESQPELAVQHFAAGETLEPTDPLFALGQAQSLIKLGRLDEATAAVARAKRINADHPLVRMVSDEITRASSSSDSNTSQRYH